LILAGDGDVALPPLRVRMVPGQVDDLLRAAPDLDRLRFDPTYPDSFLLNACGISVPRETLVSGHAQRTSIVDLPCSQRLSVNMRESIILGPQQMHSVRVCVKGGDVGAEYWFEGMSDVHVMDAERREHAVAPRGHMVLGSEGVATIILQNPQDEEVHISQEALAGCLVDLGEEEQILSSALAALDNDVEIGGDSDLGANMPRYGNSRDVRNSRPAISPSELSHIDALEAPPP
jgi:hypothetical protein